MKNEKYLKIYVNHRLFKFPEETIRRKIFGHPTEPSWKDIEKIFSEHCSSTSIRDPSSEYPAFEDIFKEMRIFVNGYYIGLQDRVTRRRG